MRDKSALRGELKLASLSILLGLLLPPVVWLLKCSVIRIFSLLLYLRPSSGSYIYLLLPAALLFALSSLIVTRVAREAEGPGLHVVIAAYFRRSGRLRPRTAPSKFLSTLLTVAPGTASGIVSPLTLIGAGISSCISRKLNIGKNEQKTLCLAGVAAAISAFLGAPLGAAIFAVEMVYGDRILYRRFFHPLLSSVTSYMLSLQMGMGQTRIIQGSLHPLSLTSAFATLLVAVVVVGVNVLYILLYQRSHDAFARLHRSVRWGWLAPLLGSLISLVLLLPLYPTLLDISAVGGGRLEVEALTAVPAPALLAAALLIMLSTSILSGSGGSGGLFMPVFTVGALTGYVVGEVTLPGHSLLFIATGISAALSTTLNVPLAATVLSMEVLGEGVAFPAAAGSLAGYLLARRFVIYHEIRWEELKGMEGKGRN